MPNAPALFIDFPNSVKGHAMNPALRVCEPERSRVVFGEIQFSKRDDDDPALHAVKVAQLEVPAAKFGVPADAVQQFVNGGHREDWPVIGAAADFLQAAVRNAWLKILQRLSPLK
jgi:hypothetical protein